MKRLVVGITLVAMLGTLVADVSVAGQTTRAATHLVLETQGEASDGRVTSSQKIRLSGQLHSPRAGCRRSKTVKLFIDGSLYGPTTTDGQGNYAFSVQGPHPEGRHEFQTKRKRTRRCKSSQSNVVTVTVGG